MTGISSALVRTGLVSKDSVEELQRWGLPVEGLLEQRPQDLSPEEIVNIICDALDNNDTFEIRDTDLDVVHTWLHPDNQQRGKLQLTVDGKKSTIAVTFCRTRLGEYVIPWRSEGIKDLLDDWGAHIVIDQKKIPIRLSRELFLGRQKAFMVCVEAGK